jgi:hypothetical protein
MTEEPQSVGRRPSEADVSRLPFTAGVVLAISGLNTLLEGLYTISYWQGWLFLVTGLVVAGTAALLIFDVPGAPVIALVAASASLIISAVWVSTYHWFNLAAIALDLVAIFALARWTLRRRAGRDPLGT